MENSFISEIKMSAINFDHGGWLLCDGRKLEVQKYMILYSILETRYGGDKESYFHIPDMRARIPLGAGKSGASYQVGQTGGSESHTQTIQVELPEHDHKAEFKPTRSEKFRLAVSTEPGDQTNPKDNYLAVQKLSTNTLAAYKTTGTGHTLGGVSGSGTKGNVSGSVEVASVGTDTSSTVDIKLDTRQPFLTINYFICADGGEYPNLGKR